MAQVPSNLIPTRVTQLPTDPTPSDQALMMYVRDGVTYKVQVADVLNVSGVLPSRQVLAGTGMVGGGQLSSDITLSIAPGGVGGTELANTGVTPGVYGSGSQIPSITIDAQGRVQAATSIPISAGTGSVSSVDVSGGATGLTTSGGPVTTSGTITLEGVLNLANGGTGATTAPDARANLSAAVLGGNSDITSLAGLTGGITTPDYITFDTTPETVPTAPGSLYWDSADGNQTLSLIMGNGLTTQQIGEEQYFRIKADAAITNGQVIMFTGSVGASGALKGAPATGLTAGTALYVMGVATEDMAHNDWGYVTSFGLVRGINTTGGAEAWVDGQLLYLDPAVAGGLTKTVPTAPNPKVVVAAVVHAASNGSLFVRPSFGGKLGDFEGDVNIVAPSTGDVLVYDGAAGFWKSAPKIVVNSKSLTIFSPSASENVTMFFTTNALTLTQARAVVSGASASVTYSLKSGTSRDTAVTTHVSAATVTSTTTGTNATISSAVIPSDSWIWLETSALSGTVTFFSINLEF